MPTEQTYAVIPPVITIVIACYNKAAFITRTLDSAVVQTYPNTHIIVVNDGSTDASTNILHQYAEKYPERLRVIDQPNQGVEVARDRGIAEASGDYIVILDADDMLLPEALTVLYDYSVAHPQFSVVYSDYYRIDTDDKVSKHQRLSEMRLQLEGNVLPALIPGGFINATALFQRAHILAVGGFGLNREERRYTGHEDYFLYLRLALAGYEFGYVPQPLFYYRDTPDSMSKNLTRFQAGRMYALQYAYQHYPDKMADAVDQMIWSDYFPKLDQLHQKIAEQYAEIEQLKQQSFHAPAYELRIGQLEREKASQHAQTDKWWADAVQFQQSLRTAQLKVQELNETIERLEQDRSWQQTQSDAIQSEIIRVGEALKTQESLTRANFTALTTQVEQLTTSIQPYNEVLSALPQPHHRLAISDSKAITRVPQTISDIPLDTELARSGVVIITRTKDRSIFLRRAINSVLDQTYENWHHVIVNDGGAASEVDRIAASFTQRYKGRVTVVHNPSPVGMQPAANIGLKVAPPAQYVLIHDDDDSLHPDFLLRCVDHLRRKPNNAKVRGVVVHSVEVIEEINDNKLITLYTRPYNNWLKYSILLYRLMAGNTFPPISFLYERAVIDEIGDYREDLIPLGDWEFNIRFLLRYEIDVIPEGLAYYHKRPSITEGTLSNSVVSGEDRHFYETGMIWNELLREEANQGIFGIGFVGNISQSFESMRAQINGVSYDLNTTRALVENQGTARSRPAHPPTNGSIGFVRGFYRGIVPTPIRLKLRDMRVGLIGR